MNKHFAFDRRFFSESTELALEIFNTPREEFQDGPHDITYLLLERRGDGAFCLICDTALPTAEYIALYDTEYAWLLDSLEHEASRAADCESLSSLPDPSSLI